jgi:hypothetical protein
MKKLLPKNLKTVLYVIIISLFLFLARNEVKSKNDIVRNGIKTTGYLVKYSGFHYKTEHSLVTYFFYAEGKKVIIKGYDYSENIFPSCEKDNGCIGRKFAVYYYSSDPYKFNVPVLNEEME